MVVLFQYVVVVFVFVSETSTSRLDHHVNVFSSTLYNPIVLLRLSRELFI